MPDEMTETYYKAACEIYPAYEKGVELAVVGAQMVTIGNACRMIQKRCDTLMDEFFHGFGSIEVMDEETSKLGAYG